MGSLGRDNVEKFAFWYDWVDEFDVLAVNLR